MELWLCPRNKFALIGIKGKATVVKIGEPFEPLEEYTQHENGYHGFVDDFVEKYKAVKATISGHEIPDDKKKILNVIDFCTLHQVRVLTPVSGHRKYLTFLAFVGEECAYLQFYVDRKGKARCMARTSLQCKDKFGVRVGSAQPAFLIFDH
jgi:hypothetical protein